MFSLETGFQKPINAGEKVIVASAANNVLFLGTDTGRLLRWDTTIDDLEEIKLTRAPKDQPRRIFPDYESRDFIVSFGTADNYYVKDSSRHSVASRLSFGSSIVERPRALGRIRGVTLTAAHFMPLESRRLFCNISELKTPPSEGGTESPGNWISQRLILLGSENGVILGLFVDSTTGKDENVVKLWNVPGAEAVYGIRGEMVSNIEMEKVYAFTAVICTSNRLYQFVGDANLEIFERNPHVLEITPPDSEIGHKTKIASGHSSASPVTPNMTTKPPIKQTISQRVCFFTVDRGRRAQKFCWTTAAGIIHGELDWKRVIRSYSSSVITNKSLIRLDGNNSPRSSVLLAASLTEFYVVLLYSDRVIFVNQLSGKIFQELNVSFTSSLRSTPPQFASIAPSSQMTRSQIIASDMVQDIVNNSLWIYSSNGYFLRLSCDNEEDGIWKVALTMNRFDVALRLSQTEEQARQVFLAQADWLADMNGAYKEASKLYAKTRKPMEEVLLKLLEAPWTVSPGELNPIIEYLISLLDQMSLDLPMQRTIIATLVLEEYCKELCIPIIVENDMKEPLKQDFDAFLQDHWQDLDLKTSFSILLSHGLWDAAVTLSVCSKKWANAIQICIQNKAYDKALDILVRAEDPEMFSKFAGYLSVHVPEELASTALLCGKEAIVKVIPALLRTFHFSSYENIRRRALSGCLNLLETLRDDPYYCKLVLHLHALDENEEAALESFQTTYPKLESQQLLDYCIFAMRCCLLGNFGKGSVQIFQSLGMLSDAVELACRMDSTYGKKIVSELTSKVENVELVRKFWLRVALAMGGSNPSSLVKVMEDSNGILQMEDVMPFMEDFLELDEDMKNAVCHSLVTSQTRIQSAIEMSSRAEETLGELEKEMEELKKKKQEEDKTLKQSDGFTFYLYFPCGHIFYDKESFLNAWTDMSRKDSHLHESMQPLESSEDRKEQYLEEQCPLCGENMIETVDQDIALDMS
ncbi:Vacuolar protein sorting-associated protein 18 [Galdieria sulphuraria]|uniref:Vacuolar protein sorting protein DigA n=1 Tax=Galdieria sulphuraria TaxID=130081 RepID=M2Y4Q9_GALSU|nr:vacuolar protein sorting protein DigA [Galdieria sulphuraria]EME30938.1 vacuolar protein sorting protein DigA [Galdieria sulphuraria]GJD11853.1 Vacuolar protein sorting-associated protein 18 [Galdieria sulphuraria]|eukprot:XP_005707458.1 vacuolar protein sorting protein DigA [Galdieria sulphuraria]